MRRFNVDADILFTNVYTPSAKYKALPFGLESFSRFRVHAQYFAERADLDCYLILYTIEGEGVLQYQGGTYRIGKNQVLFIDCGIHHIYRPAGQEDWEFYFMLIHGVGVKAYYDILFQNGFFILDFFDFNIIKKVIDNLRYLDGHQMQQFELLAGHQVHDLLVQLSLLNSANDTSDFIQATEYIERNLDQKIMVDELAALCHMSKYHFIRKFKHVYAETPHEFITRFKINKAKAILAQSDRSVAEIGESLGFNDPTTFIRAFKKVEGATPNQFRSARRPGVRRMEEGETPRLEEDGRGSNKRRL